ncbi:MAG TPA: histidine kinase [Casimicrobiaceae bacterium]|nr:histidine kinase [Casimicrobiaceae bacterium]
MRNAIKEDDVEAKFQRTGPTRELVLIVIATAAFAVFCTHVDLSERLSAWAQPHERYQLDELPVVLLFLACALTWFAWRRMREARAELARRLRAEASLQRAFDQNRRLAQVNLRLQEDERRYVARELHDELGQCVNAIKLEAVALCSTSAEAVTQSGATSIVALADRVQAATRDIVRRLRPPGLDELGLAAVLEHCIEDWRRRKPDVHFDLKAPPADTTGLSEPINIAVFRVVQEALTNAVRHSNPRRVAIDLVRRRSAIAADEELVLTVGNDGAIRGGAPSTNGLGIVGMRERIEALGGQLRSGFRSDDGFMLEATVPLQPLPGCWESVQ